MKKIGACSGGAGAGTGDAAAAELAAFRIKSAERAAARAVEDAINAKNAAAAAIEAARVKALADAKLEAAVAAAAAEAARLKAEEDAKAKRECSKCEGRCEIPLKPDPRATCPACCGAGTKDPGAKFRFNTGFQERPCNNCRGSGHYTAIIRTCCPGCEGRGYEYL